MTDSTKTPVPGKRDRTRAALIAAANEVVKERGFRAASLDEIASRAGMTKGAIYSNFGGKADLMLALAQSRSLVLAPRYVPGGSFHAQFAAVADAVIEMLPAMKARTQINADFLLYALQEPRLQAPMAEAYETLFRATAEQLDDHFGAELAHPSMALVVAIQALTLGFAQQYLVTPDRVTPDVIRRAFASLAAGATRPKRE